MSDESSSDENDSNEVIESSTNTKVDFYSDVLTKLRSLKAKAKKTEDRQSVLNDGAKYLTELLQIIEEHEDEDMSDETTEQIQDGIRTFVNTLDKIRPYNLFQNSCSLAYETFYLYLNLLKLKSMINYLKRLEMTDGIQAVYHSSIYVILYVSNLAVKRSKFTTKDLEEPLDNEETLVLLVNYANYEFESESSLTYSVITDRILHILWNYTNKTVLIPNLIKTGCLQVLLNWLDIAYRQSEFLSSADDKNRSTKEEEPKSAAIKPLINIINNISRHDDGMEKLNSIGVTKQIEKVQSATKDPKIDLLCSMTLALLSTAEQIKKEQKRMNNTLDQLLQSVVNASRAANHTDKSSHISEPLVVLVKLFNDDRSLDYILQHAQVKLDSSSTLDFLSNLLIQFNNQVNHENDSLKQVTLTALVNILWSISFQEQYQYKRQLKSNEPLITLLEQFANNDQLDSNNTQYIPKYIETIQTAAQGILLNIIDRQEQANIPVSISPIKRNSAAEALVEQSSVANRPKPMIMISYSHDDKALCYQIEQELTNKDLFRIWIDRNYCSTGDSWEHIAQGIKQAQVVLALVSKNYTSKSVRREVIYAIDKLDKPFLPVFVLKPNIPEWLDIRTCDLTYIRFKNENQVDQQTMSKLIETLQNLISGSNQPSQSPTPHYEPESTLTLTSPQQTIQTSIGKNELEKAVDRWNKDDIKHWYEQNEIPLEFSVLCRFNDGLELLNFARIFLEDEKNQYKIYFEEFARRYHGKVLLLYEFNKFSSALRKCYDQHQQQTSNVKPNSTNKSNTCDIL